MATHHRLGEIKKSRTSLLDLLGIMFLFKGNHPKMAQHFRVVNNYNLPRLYMIDT
jgi:hypothetical protein